MPFHIFKDPQNVSFVSSPPTEWTFALVDSLYCIFVFRLIDFHSYLYSFLPSPLSVFILLFSCLSCLAHLRSALLFLYKALRAVNLPSVLAPYLGMWKVGKLGFLLQLTWRRALVNVSGKGCKCGWTCEINAGILVPVYCLVFFFFFLRRSK